MPPPPPPPHFKSLWPYVPAVFQDALFIGLPSIIGEDLLLVNDDGLDDLVDGGLVGHLVAVGRDGQQGGAEADGQVVGVHHVLVAVLRQTAEVTNTTWLLQSSTSMHCMQQTICWGWHSYSDCVWWKTKMGEHASLSQGEPARPGG